MKKIIAIIVAIVVLAGAGAGYWFTRPIYKAQKAMEVKDIVKVSEVYSKLKYEEKEQISKEVLAYGEELLDSYIEQDKDYDEVMEELDKISSDIIDDEDGLEDVFEDVKMYKASRDAWDKANELFEGGDYEAAHDEYAKVIKDDYPYEDAQKKLAECAEKMVTQYAGDWYCKLDIAKKAFENQGITNYPQDFSMPITFSFELRDDKTASFFLDTENFAENFDKFMDIVIDDAFAKMAEEYGVSESEIKSLVESQLDMSFKDYIKSLINFDEVMGQINSGKDEYTYDLVDGVLVFTSENNDILEAKIDKDGNMLIDDIGDDTIEAFSELGVELPLTFVKEK